ncbi:MAG: DUF5074 domain-containing protein [Saprospiraceae bacterium]
MNTKHHISLFLISLIGLFSCEKETTPASVGNYTSGVFVVNEGPFGGTGSITWHNPETGETVQDVFEKANGGASLGQFVQSLTLHNGKGYIVVNGANKVYVVDATTFKYLDTIGGLYLPRFLLPVSANTALVSQWGADGVTGSVASVDLKTLKITETLPTGKGPDKMLLHANGQVSVPCSGGFGTDSVVVLIETDAGSLTEISRVSFLGQKNPASLAVGRFDTSPISPFTYALCQGSYLDTDPKGSINPYHGSIPFLGQAVPPFGNDLVASPNGQELFFAAGGKIYVLNKDGLSVRINQTAYGLNCHPGTGYLYCADAKDFNSQGELVVYKQNGERVSAFPVGIAPGEVIFVK